MKKRAKITKKVTNEFEQLINNNQDVDDVAVKRLLHQKQLSPLQVGRILFLDACRMFEGDKQIFTNEEYIHMVNKIKPQESTIGEYITYQRLTTYAVNSQNYLKARNESSLMGLQYIQLQARLIEEEPESTLIDSDQILTAIENIKTTLSFITVYALFFDAMRSILKNDRRIKSSYRITGQANEVIIGVKKYNEFIKKNITRNIREKYNLYPIDVISKTYNTPKIIIKELSEYLMDKFNYTNFLDNVVTMETTLYIKSYFADNPKYIKGDNG